MDDIKSLSPKQINYLQNSNCRINLSEGAVRSGKTISTNLRWIEYVMNSPLRGDFLMFGKTERTLNRNILRPMKKLLGSSFRINKGEGEATLGDRLIYFSGASDERAVQKIQGSTIAGAYGDELALAPESYFNMILSRMSLKGAKFFGTTNPDSPYHWLKTKFIDRRDNLDMSLHHFNIEDNIFLPKEYVRNLKKEYTGVFYQRYIEGKWVLAEGLVYDIFDENKHTGEIINPDKFNNYIIGVDYGTNNPCTFGLYGFDEMLPVYLIKEYYWDGGALETRQKTDSQYADDMEEFVGDKKIDAIYIDPSALSFITELRQRGKYTIKSANNEVLSGIKFVSKLLLQEKFYINQSCREAIKGYQSYVWDSRAQQRGEDKPLKQADHTADRDRYALYSHFFKRTFPTGQKYYK